MARKDQDSMVSVLRAFLFKEKARKQATQEFPQKYYEPFSENQLKHAYPKLNNGRLVLSHQGGQSFLNENMPLLNYSFETVDDINIHHLGFRIKDESVLKLGDIDNLASRIGKDFMFHNALNLSPVEWYDQGLLIPEKNDLILLHNLGFWLRTDPHRPLSNILIADKKIRDFREERASQTLAYS